MQGRGGLLVILPCGLEHGMQLRRLGSLLGAPLQQRLHARYRVGYDLGLAFVGIAAKQRAIQLRLRNVNSEKKHKPKLPCQYQRSPLRPLALYIQGPMP